MDVSRVLLGAAGAALGFVLLLAANEKPSLQASFLFDHITKLFIFVLTVESLSQALCGLERLLGFDTRLIIDRGFLARTPADFWRRYNTRVQPWLYWNVFVPSGGRRAPPAAYGRRSWSAPFCMKSLSTLRSPVSPATSFYFFSFKRLPYYCPPGSNVSRAAGARGVTCLPAPSRSFGWARPRSSSWMASIASLGFITQASDVCRDANE